MKGYSTFPKAPALPSDCLKSFPEHSFGGIMVIVVGNGHGDTSSNLGRD